MNQNKRNALISSYCCKEDLDSYDPYDIWKTKIGIFVKKLFYKNKYIGLLPAATLTLFDVYINNKMRFFYSRQEYPIVRAQAALALMNLYEGTQDQKYLTYAKIHVDWLLENSSQGYSGYCWGLNFQWVYSVDKIYDANTPFSTHTPYPLEALIRYYEITLDKRMVVPIKSVFDFLEKDLQIMKENDQLLIISYGAEKDRIVTNANAYVMYMYALLLPFLSEKDQYIKKKIEKIYNFLLSVQNKNGSWIYQPYDDSFIDCFHSAFVLKNIYKTNKLAPLKESSRIIKKGYNYILDQFLDEDYFLFKRFSLSNKPSLVKFDLYDNAEMLNLAILLNDFKIAEKLNKSINKNFIDKDSIYSTIDIFGYKKNENHMRWAVAPYLYALSNIKDR